jgi:hypothetical protein
MKLPMASARGRSDAQRTADQRTFVALRDVLIQGKPYGGARNSDGELFSDPARRKR